jgi:hypothetical protein
LKDDLFKYKSTYDPVKVPVSGEPDYYVFELSCEDAEDPSICKKVQFIDGDDEEV